MAGKRAHSGSLSPVAGMNKGPLSATPTPWGESWSLPPTHNAPPASSSAHISGRLQSRVIWARDTASLARSKATCRGQETEGSLSPPLPCSGQERAGTSAGRGGVRPAGHPINPSCLPSAAGSQGHPRDSRGQRWAGSTSSSPGFLEAPPLLAACSPPPCHRQPNPQEARPWLC